MSKNYYPRIKNIQRLCFALLTLCCTLGSQKAMAQPTISSVSPGIGIGGVTSVTITGTNFSATPANDTVFFGATLAAVTTASTTSLTVTVPIGAIYAPVSVLNHTTHLTGYSEQQFLPRFDTSCFVNNQVNFQSPITLGISTYNEAASVSICDVDGDGKPDIIVGIRNQGAPPAPSYIAIYRNTSTSGSISLSSFASPVFLSPSTGVLNIKTVDLDGDGKPEIISCGPNVAGFDVFRNTCTSGTISFAAKRTYGSSIAPYETAIADFDGDGKPDIAIICSFFDSLCIFRNLITTPGTFVAGSFSTHISYHVARQPQSVCAADIDGDGKPDLLVTSDFKDTLSIFRNTISAPGPFSAASSFGPRLDFHTGSHPLEVQTGDIDGDGKPDVIVADSNSSAVSVFFNMSTSGTIALATKVDFTTQSQPASLTLGDVNGDGKVDIATANLNGTVSILRNLTTSSGSITSSSFAAHTDYTIGALAFPIGIALGDLDGDTRPDMVAANYGGSNVSVFRNNPVPFNDTIVGPATLCYSTTGNYTNTATGGTWAITSHTGSTISTFGIVTAGTTAGNDTVTYTITCGGDANIAKMPITIVATTTVLPIAGTSSVCVGDSTQLTDATPGGVWGNPTGLATATVDTNGWVHGISSGGTTITYALASACGVVSSYFPITVNAAPGAISGPSSVCVGSNITLTDGAGGTWAGSGAATVTTVSGNGVVHGAVTGTAVVSYTLTSTGCRVTDTILVTTLPSSITGSDTLCTGVSSFLHDAGTGVWNSASPGVATIDSVTGLVTGVGPGSSIITFGITGSGCYATDTVYVNPIGPPVISITSTPASAICAGTVVTYQANTVGGGAAPIYQWMVNGLNAGTASSITYIPANGDHISVKLFSTSPCVSPDSAIASLVVALTPTILPSVSIHTVAGSDTVCAGNSTTVVATPVNGGTSPMFEWYVNHVPVGYGSVFGYTPANGDIVNVSMESSVACPAIDTARDTLVLTVVPYATPTVTLSGTDSICAGYPELFYADATFPGSAPIYDWTVNGINVSTTNPLSYLPATTGDVVQLTLTSNYPCLTFPVAISETETIQVFPVVLPTVSIYASNTIVLPGMSMVDTFKAITTNAGANPTYQWFNNGTAVSGATDLEYVTSAIPSRDSISVVVTNTDFCENISVYSYAIIDTGENVGVPQLNAGIGSVTILPNPNNGNFIVKADLGMVSGEEVTIEITNMLGQVAYTRTVRAQGGIIDERVMLDNDMGAGVYMMSIHSEHMNRVVRFVVDK